MFWYGVRRKWPGTPHGTREYRIKSHRFSFMEDDMAGKIRKALALWAIIVALLGCGTITAFMVVETAVARSGGR
jgi:hypothetical protein